MKLNLATLFLISFILVLSSCTEYEGCTDPNADNYYSLADIDDGSCEYSGSVVFWYGEDLSFILYLYDIDVLKYYIDNELIGTSASTVYWTAAPNCGQTASVTANIDLGGSQNKSFTYSIRDETGEEHFDGIVNVTANSCEQKELTDD